MISVGKKLSRKSFSVSDDLAFAVALKLQVNVISTNGAGAAGAITSTSALITWAVTSGLSAAVLETTFGLICTED